jgi:hypothetical protein
MTALGLRLKQKQINIYHCYCGHCPIFRRGCNGDIGEVVKSELRDVVAGTGCGEEAAGAEDAVHGPVSVVGVESEVCDGMEDAETAIGSEGVDGTGEGKCRKPPRKIRYTGIYHEKHGQRVGGVSGSVDCRHGGERGFWAAICAGSGDAVAGAGAVTRAGTSIAFR